MKKVCGFKALMFNMESEDEGVDEYYDKRIPIDVKKLQNDVVMEEKTTLLDQLLERYHTSDDCNKKRLIIVIKSIVPKLLKTYRGKHAIKELVDTTTIVGSETVAFQQFRRETVEEIKKEKLRWETIDVLRRVLEILPESEDNSETTSIHDAIKWGERLRRRQIFLMKLEKERKATDPHVEFVTPPSDTWHRWCEGLYFAKEDIFNREVPENIPNNKFMTVYADFLGNYEDVNRKSSDVISFIERGDSEEERNKTMKMALGHVKEYLRGCTNVIIGLSWTVEMGIYVRYGHWAIVPDMKVLRQGYEGDFPVGKVSEEAYWALAVFYSDSIGYASSYKKTSSDDSTSS